MVNPTDVGDWEDRAGVIVRSAWRQPPIEEPVLLSCEFVFPRPEYLNEKGHDAGPYCFSRVPDFDNCLKAACDALKKGLVLHDDSLVFWGLGVKLYAGQEEKPHVKVAIYAPFAPDALPRAAR